MTACCVSVPGGQFQHVPSLPIKVLAGHGMLAGVRDEDGGWAGEFLALQGDMQGEKHADAATVPTHDEAPNGAVGMVPSGHAAGYNEPVKGSRS